MKLDKTFANDILKAANGDGSREARFAFLRPAKAAAKELSCIHAPQIFNKVLKSYGRETIAICVAVTILNRKERMERLNCEWAREVLKLWTNRPNDIFCVAINDGLHPTRIEEYAGTLIRITINEA